MTLTSIAELEADSSSETVFLAEPRSYLDGLVCFVRLLMPRFYTVVVLQAASPDLPVALKSGCRGHFSLTGVSWRETTQNIVSLTYALIWWQWKELQSVGLIKNSAIRSRDILVTHITVLLLYNIL